ncbi:zinc finger CCCH domain-containing protein 13 [Drosophila albomicans]|uniref:Zinc finger CCCH domain-containing protein 13 n=1 Tax=Drosophila albomicans TaxID=7291 RepID=A0A6P8WHM6_DROAB|nr:zinc finger CCCH domain-containing protein 13 [Drosophila albomicans]
MSARRAQSLPPHMLEPEKPQRGRCVAAICFSWKVLTCIVSHVLLVLLVVSYCVGGAYLFQHLERPHEIEVKKDIQNLRFNLTERIWLLSDDAAVLRENDWMANVSKHLANFEKQILTAIKADGWDGDEDVRKSQWTFAGSLFYSIIVITTIGYGHISPRTDWGKVTTIFYAIVGIPLMLLCLSNIGDVMATSFRFLYWRICCYVCTRSAKRPKSRDRRSRQRSIRMRPQRVASRSQPPPSFRRSMKLTQRSNNDSGLGPSMGHAYSDPELRYGRGAYDDRDRERDRDFGGGHRGSSGRQRRHQQQQQHQIYTQPLQHEPRQRHTIYGDEYEPQNFNRATRYSSRQRQRDRMRDRHTVERERYLGHSRTHIHGSIDDFSDMNPPAKRAASVRSVRSPQPQHQHHQQQQQETRASRELHRLHSAPGRAKSVDPRHNSSHYEDVDEDVVRKTPIIPNRYALDDDDLAHRGQQARNAPRSQSMPRSAHRRRQREMERERSPAPVHHHQQQQRPNGRRAGSLGRQSSRYGNHLEPPDYDAAPQRQRRGRSPRYHDDYVEESFDEQSLYDDNDIYEDYPVRHSSRSREPRRERRRERRLPPSPRIMSPMGFPVQRQIRRRSSYDYDEEDSTYGDDYGDRFELVPKDRPVPIWLCVFLVVSYILGGAVLFAFWEKWSFLDSAYFCFITLTTIGFGDFVPAKGVKDESEQSIAYCSLYLLFGIALLAMSFNLVQEEFIANVKEVARRLGILKDDEDEQQEAD